MGQSGTKLPPMVQEVLKFRDTITDMKTSILLFISAVILGSECGSVVKPSLGRYEPTWDSLDTRPLPSWYDDAKIWRSSWQQTTALDSPTQTLRANSPPNYSTR